MIAMIAGALGLQICIAGAIDAFRNRRGDVANAAAVLQEFQPGLVLDEVMAAPVNGWQQAVNGTQVIYVSDDGRYALSGSLLDLKERVNLTEKVQSQKAASMLESAGKTPLHVYKPQGQVRGRVYVFTDPTCGFCSRLHKELPELQARGIEVTYLAFPRGGTESPGYSPLAAAICRSDRDVALDQAFSGSAVSGGPCPNNLLDHYRLGERLQIAGTPAIFSENGRQIGGYLSPDQMVEALSIKPGLILPRGSVNGK